jgi:hypothetical protein
VHDPCYPRAEPCRRHGFGVCLGLAGGSVGEEGGGGRAEGSAGGARWWQGRRVGWRISTGGAPLSRLGFVGGGGDDDLHRLF